MEIQTSNRAGQGNRAVRPVIVITALLVSAVAALGGDDPCKTRICREGFRFDGHRCESGPAPITLARSHYDPALPLCPADWHADGQYCVKDDCCFRPACRGDEKYEDGLCNSGPTTFGWRSHRTATCPTGWTLLRASGLCRLDGCEDVQPHPPARAAGPTDGPPHTHQRDDTPPPPARAAGAGDDPPTVRAPVVTGFSARPCVDRGGQVTIEGRNFGPVQGTRLVELGGHGIGVLLQVSRWSNQAIIVTVPDDPRIQYSQWYYIGIQNSDRQWVSNINRNITICRGLE